MCDYGKLMQLDANTEGLIEADVARRVAARETFYAGDVTNAVKGQGGIGRHRDMAPAVREAFFSGAMDGYEMIPTRKIDFRGNREDAFLYAPVGADPALIDAELARVITFARPNAGSDGVGVRTGDPIPAPSAVFAGLGNWINGSDDEEQDEDEEDEEDEEDRPLP